jgi:hypothetical protein
MPTSLQKMIRVLIVIGVIAIVVIGFWICNRSSGVAVLPPAPSVSAYVALLDPSNTLKGAQAGCDTLVMQHINAPIGPSMSTSTSPNAMNLSATIAALLSPSAMKAYPWPPVAGKAGDFAATQGGIALDHVTLQSGGVASLYFKGSLGPIAGVCDDPRLAVQIRETVLAFPGIVSYQTYLNGTKNNLLPPSEKGK